MSTVYALVKEVERALETRINGVEEAQWDESMKIEEKFEEMQKSIGPIAAAAAGGGSAGGGSSGGGGGGGGDMESRLLQDEKAAEDLDLRIMHLEGLVEMFESERQQGTFDVIKSVEVRRADHIPIFFSVVFRSVLVGRVMCVLMRVIAVLSMCAGESLPDRERHGGQGRGPREADIFLHRWAHLGGRATATGGGGYAAWGDEPAGAERRRGGWQDSGRDTTESRCAPASQRQVV